MENARPRHSILLVSNVGRVDQLLNEILPSSRFAPVHTVTTCGEARRILADTSYDIIVVNAPLGDDFGLEFALDAVQDSTSGVILIVRSEMYAEISYRAEEYGVLVVPKPCSKGALHTAVQLAAATRVRLQAFEKKNAGLTAKMNEIRIVNRAKWILITTLNMTEEHAHRYIEKQAMDLRQSRQTVAENIIRTYEK